MLSSDDYYDPYTSNSGTDTNYWGNSYSLKSSPRRILYNPFAHNIPPSIDSLTLEGSLSIFQT